MCVMEGGGRVATKSGSSFVPCHYLLNPDTTQLTFRYNAQLAFLQGGLLVSAFNDVTGLLFDHLPHSPQLDW